MLIVLSELMEWLYSVSVSSGILGEGEEELLKENV
jgi:hypothetical protein